MKNTIGAVMFFLLSSFTSLAQGNVGIGTTPNAAAQLEVASTNKGILIPRITKSNRPAAATEGLLIYQTDNNPGFYYYKGSTWTRIIDSSSNPGTMIPFSSGNAVTLIPGNLFSSGVAVGFGNSSQIQEEAGVTDIGATGNMAFVAARSGILNALSAWVTTSGSQSFGSSTMTVSVNVFESFGNSTAMFSVGPNMPLTPSFTGATPAGSVATLLATGLNIPIVQGRRYIFVFFANSNPIFAPIQLSAYLSGGININ